MRYEFPAMAFQNSLQAACRNRQGNTHNVHAQQASGVAIHEFKSQLVLSVDVPGIPEDELEVEFENGRLTVSGQRASLLPEGATSICHNHDEGNFERTFRIDDSFDPNSVDAVLSNGVLTIKITRRPELQPRKVTVRPAGQSAP